MGSTYTVTAFAELLCRHVVSECIDHFLAGTETTSVVLTYCLWQLSRHPTVQQKLQDELDEIMADPAEMLSLNVLTNLP